MVAIYSFDNSFTNFEPFSYSMSGCNCCFLTCIHIYQEAGKVVWYSHLLKNFPQFVVIHTVKGCSIINEADVFLEFPCFFYDPKNAGSLISVYFAFSKSSCASGSSYFLVHILLKSDLKDFKHFHARMWNECSCTVVWTFFGRTGMKTDLF